MNTAQKVGVGVFLAGLVSLAVFFLSSSSYTFVLFGGAGEMLLLVGAVVFLSGFVMKKFGLQKKGKLAEIAIVVVLLLLFLAPAVPAEGGAVCNANGCSELTVMSSVTHSLWCWGARYQWDGAIQGPSFQIEFGIQCNPPPV